MGWGQDIHFSIVDSKGKSFFLCYSFLTVSAYEMRKDGRINGRRIQKNAEI